jgi:hypothetical protein
MHASSPSKKRQDVWQWFVEEESRTGMRTVKHGKIKVYCARCLDVDKETLREKDEKSEIDRTDEDRYRECRYIMASFVHRADNATSVCRELCHAQ